MKDLTDLAKEVAAANAANGFWDESENSLIIPTKLALIHDEVSEALQAHRDNYDGPEKEAGMTSEQEAEFAEELADIIIRTLDLAGHYGFPIGEILEDKLDKNRSRPAKHGKRY